MNKLSRSVTGMLLMGGAFVGAEIYRNDVIDDIDEKRMECYVELEGDEATACVNSVENANYSMLALAEGAILIGGIACGVQAYRAVRDDER